MSSFTLSASSKISIIGSGSWGTAIARRIAQNIQQNNKVSNKIINMWVFDEVVNGRSLIDIINNDHENPKYLPNFKLPENVLACGDLDESCDADVLIFV